MTSEDPDPNSLTVSFGGGVQSTRLPSAVSMFSGSSESWVGFLGGAGSGCGLKCRLTPPVCFLRGFGGFDAVVSSTFPCGGTFSGNTFIEAVPLPLAREVFPLAGAFFGVVVLGWKRVATSAACISTKDASAGSSRSGASSTTTVIRSAALPPRRPSSTDFKRASLAWDRAERATGFS